MNTTGACLVQDWKHKLSFSLRHDVDKSNWTMRGEEPSVAARVCVMAVQTPVSAIFSWWWNTQELVLHILDSDRGLEPIRWYFGEISWLKEKPPHIMLWEGLLVQLN